MALNYDAVVRLRDQASGPAKQVARNINQMSGSIQRAQQRIRAQRDSSLQLASNLTVTGAGAVAAGRKITQAMKSPTDVAIGFEQAMSKVQALTRLDLDIPKQAKLLDDLKKKALALGESTSFSASQVAAGQSFLAMAGFNPQKIIAAMPGMLDLAKAGDMGLARTADIASNIMSGFNMSADQVGRIGDVMAYTFTTSNLNMQQLGETMKYVAPIASKAGASIETVAAMSGALGDVGLQGSMAGTALRSAFLRLADSPKEAKKQLAELGVKVKDSAGKMRPMLSILADLKKRMLPLKNGAQIEAISTIFGAEAASGMTELVMNVEKVQKKYNAIMKESEGTSSRVAKVMGQNTAGNVKKLKSAVEGLQISLGNYLLPHLNESIATVTKIVKHIQSWVKENPDLVRSLVKIAVYIGKIVTSAGMLLIALAAIIGPFAMLRYATKMATIGLFAFGGRVTWLSRIMGLIKLASLAGIISLLGIGSAFAYTGEDAQTFANKIPVIGEWLSQKLPGIADKAKASLDVIKAAIRGDSWTKKLGTGGVASLLFKIAFDVDPAVKLQTALEKLRITSSRLWQAANPALTKLSNLVSTKLKNAYATLDKQIASGQAEKYLTTLGNKAQIVGNNVVAFGKGIYKVGEAVAKSIIWLKDAVGGWENLGKVLAAAYVMSKLAAFLGALAAIVSILSGLGTIIALLAPAVAFLATAIGAISLPVLAVVAAVAALAYAAYWLYTNWETVKKAFIESSWGQKIIGVIESVELAVILLKSWWEDTKNAFRDTKWGGPIVKVLETIEAAIAKAKAGFLWLMQNANPVTLPATLAAKAAGFIQEHNPWGNKTKGRNGIPSLIQGVNQGVNQAKQSGSVLTVKTLLKDYQDPWKKVPRNKPPVVAKKVEQTKETVKTIQRTVHKTDVKTLLKDYQDPWKKQANSQVKPIKSPQGSMNSFMQQMKGQHELTLNLKSAPGVKYEIENQKTTGNASTFNLGNQAGADR